MSYGSRKRGLWLMTKFELHSSPAYNVEPVTNTSSSSCANSARQTPRCAQRLPPFVAALFFTLHLRDSYGWQHCTPVCSEARHSFRIAFLPTPPAFDATVRGFPSEYRHPVRRRKTRMVWLPDGEKNLIICVFVLSNFWHNWRTCQTGRRTDTDTAWRHRPRLCIASRGKQ